MKEIEGQSLGQVQMVESNMPQNRLHLFVPSNMDILHS